MEKLPKHGRIEFTRCFGSCDRIEFDVTQRTEDNWRITANPLAWGNDDPEVIVLGFSKGPTQSGALSKSPHNEIAYKGSRGNVGKILKHVGLLQLDPGQDAGLAVSRLLADNSGRFHFGSLIRCTVERHDKNLWKGSGGGMLDKFVSTPFGKEISNNCTTRFLKNLPIRTKLIVMFGMGMKLGYVHETFDLYRQARGGEWKWLNEVAYTDGKVTVVHVEHFASQGRYIPEWLGKEPGPRGSYGDQARDAVNLALKNDNPTKLNPLSSNEKIALMEQPDSKPKKVAMSKSSDLKETTEIEVILAEVTCAGYKLINQNKKLAEFISPAGQVIYVVKTSANINNIKIMVHPSLKSEHLVRLGGVESVSDNHRYHSNMPRFPKKIHSGEKEITYGWQLSISTVGNLVQFLTGFKEFTEKC